MKNFGILSLIVLAFGFFASCKDDTPSDTLVELTAEEKQDLLYMREEEKLARDVYEHLYEKYELDVFKNIGNAEQKHMDKLLGLINKYGLEDPVALSPEVGQFGDEDLQTLYDDLVAKGDISLVEALVVGMTIEDVDIFDLDNAIDNTDKADVIDVYSNLNCGSRNHMRAFYGQLTTADTTYAAQFITQEKMDEVVSGDHEQCGQ